MIIEKLNDKIFYYKKVLNDPNKIVQMLENLDERSKYDSQIPKWNKWTASDQKEHIYGVSKEGAFSNIRFGCDMDLSYAIFINNIKFISDICLSHYCNITMQEKPILPDHFSIRRYDTGSDMGKHVDSEDPTDVKHPVISGVFYLNDDYKGGEIEFENQNISIKPEAGSLLIFPSERPFLHHPKKISEGNKYMIPLFWFNKNVV